jgi:hypothetical protein
MHHDRPRRPMPAKSQTTRPSIHRDNNWEQYHHNESEDQESGMEPGM